MTMSKAILLLVLAVSAQFATAKHSDISIESGVYSNIVLGVKAGTKEPTDGQAFLNNIKNFLNNGSSTFHSAMDTKASFGQATLVIPRSWNKEIFSSVLPAEPSMTIESSDILIHDDSEKETLPNTLQAEECGVPGRQITMPLRFLSLDDQQAAIYGSPGAIFAHEWARYRYGVKAETGYPGDEVYPSAYGSSYTLASCSVNTPAGNWRTKCTAEGIACKPGNDGCYYCLDGTNTPTSVQASLGYMPALSTGRFCDKTTHNSEAPTPQNIMCNKLSVTDLIMAHPDYLKMKTHSLGDVEIVVRQEPLGRVLLLLDTPDPNSEGLDYNVLLKSLKEPLTRYETPFGIITYKADASGSVILEKKRDMQPISADQYSTLESLLPGPPEIQYSVPVLANVLAKVFTEEIELEHDAGTLIIMPITDALLVNSQLNKSFGEFARKFSLKALFLFAETTPSLATVSPFICTSGTRFITRNDTTGPADFAAVESEHEVQAFVNTIYSNNHPLVGSKSATLKSQESLEESVYYQDYVVQYPLVSITSDRPVSELAVTYINNYGVTKPCGDLCTMSTESNTILYKGKLSDFQEPGKRWRLFIKNEGPSTANVDTLWSEHNFVAVGQELNVDVWFSEGRGPIAPVSEDKTLSLYVSVHEAAGYQILGDRINVSATFQLIRATGQTFDYQHQLLDLGTDGDVRRDDSVFTYKLNLYDPAYLNDATLQARVTEVRIIGKSDGYDTRSSRAGTAHPSSSGHARLLTKDPSKHQCCGSFVKTPDIDIYLHKVSGYNLVLSHDLPDILFTMNTSTTITTTSTSQEPTSQEPTSTSPDPTSTSQEPTSTSQEPDSSSSDPTSTSTVTTIELETTTDGASTVQLSVTLFLVGVMLQAMWSRL